MPLQAAGQERFDQGFDLGLAKMQEMPGHVEGKAVHLVGAAEASGLALALEEPVRKAIQVIGGAQSGEAGADDGDHDRTRSSRISGGTTSTVASTATG